jgi:uncharacterized protein
MLTHYVRSTCLVIGCLLAASIACAGEPTSRDEAARECFRLVGGEHFLDNYLEAMMPAIRSNPRLAPYEDVVREWFSKVKETNHLEDQMVKLYAEIYSEEELRELIAFYRSPIGRKTLAKMPEIMRRGGELGAQWAKENGSLLDAMIAKRKEAEAKTTPTP